jgi:hypothetical protein
MVLPDPRIRSTSSATLLAAALAASVLAMTGCQGGPDRCDTGDAGSPDPGSCDPDPLRTDLPPLWNGLSVDLDDCPILEFTAKYDEPDAMIFKAMIKVESNFQHDAVGCTGNGPCCPEIGWSAAECACLGVMQTGPECGPSTGLGLLPDGHPNLQTGPGCADWANSVFNPVVNVELGIAGVARNRERMKQDFPGCTEDQYTMMAIGEYNHYHSTQSCTVFNFDYDSAVLEAYAAYAAAAGWPAHPYVAQ